jgi:hypothetical protein
MVHGAEFYPPELYAGGVYGSLKCSNKALLPKKSARQAPGYEPYMIPISVRIPRLPVHFLFIQEARKSTEQSKVKMIKRDLID